MQFGEQNWPAAEQAQAQTQKVVVVPIGALEQHGEHLPLLTDSLIATEVTKRVEAELSDEVLLLPTLWIGASDHHRAFAGTVSLQAETYVHVIKDILDSLIGSGFRRILFVNAHMGNVVPTQLAMSDKQIEYRHQHPDLYLVLVSWFDLLTPQILQSIQPTLSQTLISHACEWETSAIQAIRPDLVGDHRPATRRTFDSAFWSPDFRERSRVTVARTLEQSSASGALGYPERAMPEKGEALLATAARELAAFLREFAGWPAPLGDDTLETIREE